MYYNPIRKTDELAPDLKSITGAGIGMLGYPAQIVKGGMSSAGSCAILFTTTAHMMKQRTGQITTIAIAFLLLAACLSAALAITPAGTSITTSGTAQYYSTSGTLMPTVKSNTVTTTVSQVGAVSLSPTSSSKANTPGSPVYFPVTVTNAGNGSDTFDFSTFAQSGSSVSIYKDDNGDGIHQSTETTKVTSTSSLSVGGTYKCVASVQTPSGTSTDTVTLTASSHFDSTKTAKATLSVTNGTSPTDGYIMTWLLNGYYSNTSNSTRLSTDYLGGEATVAPSESSVSGGKTWAKWVSPYPRVDLVSAFGAQTYCAGYALVYINSPSAQGANLLLGSDNGVKVWLNGQNIWTNDSTRGYTADQDKVAVNLNAGWNRLLVKVSQYGGSWCFSAKLCDSTGNALSGLSYSVNNPAGGSGSLTISNVTLAALGSTTAQITWDTNVASSTQVQYGTTTSFGQTYNGTGGVTHHVANLTGLKPSTQYYLRVGSADSSGVLVWNDNGYNFTTNALTTTTTPYIMTWLLNGYYTNTNTSTRLSTDYLGGEATVAPSEGSVSGGKTWTKWVSPNPRVDLVSAFGAQSSCAGYAAAYVYSPSAQSAYLLLGSDNGVKVWLNGQNIWTNDSTRGYTADQDKVAVNLNAGWNRLLIKVSQYGGNWCFDAKLCDSAGNLIPGLAYTLAPI